MVKSITLECEPSWGPYPTSRIHIRKDKRNMGVASLKSKGGSPEIASEIPPNSSKILSEEMVANLLKQLSRTRIPIYPEFQMGMDGEWFTLKLEEFGYSATYHWWSDCGKWKPIAKIANQIWSIFFREDLREEY